MVTKGDASVETLIAHADEQVAESPTRRKRRVRVRRDQKKYPRWVRLALWLGLPVALWAAIYLSGRALL